MKLLVPVEMPSNIEDHLARASEMGITCIAAIKAIDGGWWIGVWSPEHAAFRVWADDMVCFLELSRLEKIVVVEERHETKPKTILS